jgi:hypothetical protein
VPLGKSFPRKTKQAGAKNDFCQSHWQKIKGGSLLELFDTLAVLFGMKLKWIVVSGASGCLAVLLAWLLSARGDNVVGSAPLIVLSSVPVPEIPAKAADLVHAAVASDREQTARDVLRAASGIARPGVLPYVVSAICRRNPEVAGCVVATAIELQPQHVVYFSQAAFCAAPGQVEHVVVSACNAAPASCADVALVAFWQLPSATNLILSGLGSALPGLKPYLAQAQIQAGTNDFEAVIRRTVQLLSDASGARAK